MTKTDDTENMGDLQLLAALVAKRLRQDYGVDAVPAACDYRLADSKTFFQAGKEVQVDVHLGRGLKVVVYDVWWHTDKPAELDSLLRNSSDIADKVAETMQDADAIRAMVSEVSAAAKREIAKARRRGLPYLLTSITLPPLEAGRHDQTVVRVEHLAYGRSLQLEPFEFCAESAEDVMHAFAGIAEEQARNKDNRDWLDHIGATGRIDSVVVAALGEAGLDLPEVLVALRDAKEWIVGLDAPGGKRFTLHWDEGAVRGQIQLGDGVSWHQGRLSLGRAARTLKKLPKESPLNQLFQHPFLEDRIRIWGDYKTKGEHLLIHCSEAMLNFDADSGRLWAA